LPGRKLYGQLLFQGSPYCCGGDAPKLSVTPEFVSDSTAFTDPQDGSHDDEEEGKRAFMGSWHHI